MAKRVDCPACYAIVLPRSDGTCPSCDASTLGPKSEIVAMDVGEGTALPELCASCAAVAARHVKVERARARPERGWLSVLFSTLGLLTGVFLFGRGFRLLGGGVRGVEDPGQVDDVVLQIPLCASCAKDGPPRVLQTDFHRARLTLIVHRRFRAAARQLRKKKRR